MKINLPSLLFSSAFYQKIPGVYKQFSNDKYETVSDAAACATACNNGEITPCNSFEYCPGTNLCTLSTHHASDGLAVNNQGTCDFYASKLIITVFFEIKSDHHIGTKKDRPACESGIWSAPSNSKKYFTSFVYAPSGLHPHFYIVKLGFTAVYNFSHFSF